MTDKDGVDSLMKTTRSARRAGAAPTIYDIARLAGVNPSTVSRALTQPGRINEKTEQRIHAAARELDYRVNPLARALPTGRTNTVGVIFSDITNPILFDMVRGAERAASEAGYTLVIAESQESEEREAEAADRVLPSVDGLVLASTRLDDDQIRGLAAKKPVVLINRHVDDVMGVLPDVDAGVEEALAHLAELGHKIVMYLPGPATSWISRQRGRALNALAQRFGMSILEGGPGLPTLDGGRIAADTVLASPATAVVAFNDLMAIGLLRMLTESGVAVPERLSIVGFDNIFGSDFTTPPLTTIRMPLELAGEQAVRALLHSVTTGEPSASGELLPTSVIVRGSTGRAFEAT
ncbi:MAG: LacI family DNA-binding transcriptional regulator [Cryobacterium sp.]|nr:LacI family DNA-binding transcriptional regulator [Cryobacterium sp.]